MTAVYLERFDSARNMARFYLVDIAPMNQAGTLVTVVLANILTSTHMDIVWMWGRRLNSKKCAAVISWSRSPLRRRPNAAPAECSPAHI